MKDFHRSEALPSYENLKVVLIDNRAYRSHVGIKRVLSLRDFHKNFEKRFPTLDEFDVIYSAYPPIGHNLAILRYLDRKKTRFIVDIQDVWPESFSSVLPSLQAISPHLLPFARSANKVYANADAIIAVSRTYLERALSVHPDVKSHVAYIGTEFDMINTVPKSGGPTRLFYIGTLSYSYDIETVIRAVHDLASMGREIEFNIFGNGPDLTRLQSLPHKGTIFHGHVPYKELEARLREQHIAVNSIRSKAPQSVTNKLCDYLGLGCPILNSQECAEARSLLSKVTHRNYRAGDIASAKEEISSLLDDNAIHATWRSDATFSREAISRSIIDFVEMIEPRDLA